MCDCVCARTCVVYVEWCVHLYICIYMIMRVCSDVCAYVEIERYGEVTCYINSIKGNGMHRILIVLVNRCIMIHAL